MRVHPHIPVGEIAAAMPHTTKLFELAGIDYVQHGNLSLRDACAEAGADPSAVKQAIEAMPTPPDETNWADASMQDLLEELRDRRHPALHARLSQIAFEIASQPPGRQADGLREAFNAFSSRLQGHMKREEQVLFPVVQHLEDCWTRNEPLAIEPIGGIAKPIGALVMEHTEVLGLLTALVDAAEKTGLRHALEETAHELREHIHLENNVLFPRACAIDAAVHGAGRAI